MLFTSPLEFTMHSLCPLAPYEILVIILSSRLVQLSLTLGEGKAVWISLKRNFIFPSPGKLSKSNYLSTPISMYPN